MEQIVEAIAKHNLKLALEIAEEALWLLEEAVPGIRAGGNATWKESEDMLMRLAKAIADLKARILSGT